MFWDVGSLGTGGTGLKCGSKICSIAMSSSFFVVWKPLIDRLSTLNLVFDELCCDDPNGWSLWIVADAEFLLIARPWFLAVKLKELKTRFWVLIIINRVEWLFGLKFVFPGEKWRKTNKNLSKNRGNFNQTKVFLKGRQLIFYKVTVYGIRKLNIHSHFYVR